MISLVSRQVWPQMLAVKHLQPARLFLVHTADRRESLQPARRLKRFFEKTRMVKPGNIHLVQTDHTEFAAVRETLEACLTGEADSLINITGGNKLMAAAAYDFARRRRIPAFYIERGYCLTWFEFDSHGNVVTRNEDFPRDTLDDQDPVDLVRCHMDASEIECEGELRQLRPGAEKRLERVGQNGRVGFSPDELMQVIDPIKQKDRAGDKLELMTAYVLLSLGVPMVRRGIRLKSKGDARGSFSAPHTEIDLVFNFRGRIWIVDCKDRADWQWIPELIEERLWVKGVVAKQYLLERVNQSLFESEFKHLKHDIYSARELGGLNAGIICVRKEALSGDELQYASLTGVHVVLKRDLTGGLRRILYPEAPAAKADFERVWRRGKEN